MEESEIQHLPSINTFSGVLNLVALCLIVILGNVLDFRTYSAPNQKEGEKVTSDQRSLMQLYDRNDIPGNERLAICYARGVALHMVKWVRSCCIIRDVAGEIVEDLPSIYLVEILNALLAYKERADKDELQGAPHCTMELLDMQVSNIVKCDAQLERLWQNRADIPNDSLVFSFKSGYSVDWKTGWEDKWKGSASGMSTGASLFSCLYLLQQGTFRRMG